MQASRITGGLFPSMSVLQAPSQCRSHRMSFSASTQASLARADRSGQEISTVQPTQAHRGCRTPVRQTDISLGRAQLKLGPMVPRPPVDSGSPPTHSLQFRAAVSHE
ncbi:hypothetical protein NDU88_001332 [Pleurodeles waltl]|uniref:Uncharacterized protein n=1 Tax=Pleurodeles waltl TaxID=8319 RepID=A0AAV7TJT5_PLEWA|nr:hypothetical protein NDU88_001332 [Pleurodeles waltl]